jgi:hypothetical protein
MIFEELQACLFVCFWSFATFFCLFSNNMCLMLLPICFLPCAVVNGMNICLQSASNNLRYFPADNSSL